MPPAVSMIKEIKRIGFFIVAVAFTSPRLVLRVLKKLNKFMGCGALLYPPIRVGASAKEQPHHRHGYGQQRQQNDQRPQPFSGSFHASKGRRWRNAAHPLIRGFCMRRNTCIGKLYMPKNVSCFVPALGRIRRNAYLLMLSSSGRAAKYFRTADAVEFRFTHVFKGA